MIFKKSIFVVAILLSITFILNGCSKRFDNYDDKSSFYLETIKWGTSIKDIQKQKSDSNNIRTFFNVRGLRREDDHMMFQNIKYKGIEGYISYNFYNNKKLYLIEYALIEKKGEYNYDPLNLSVDEIIELSKEKKKYEKMKFELDYNKLVDYIKCNNIESEIDKNHKIIRAYNDLKKVYGEPSEVNMPTKDDLEIKVIWKTKDTDISLISRQNGLAGEQRNLIIRYEDTRINEK